MNLEKLSEYELSMFLVQVNSKLFSFFCLRFDIEFGGSNHPATWSMLNGLIFEVRLLISLFMDETETKFHPIIAACIKASFLAARNNRVNTFGKSKLQNAEGYLNIPEKFEDYSFNFKLDCFEIATTPKA